MKIHSLSTHTHADDKWGEVFIANKTFLYLNKKKDRAPAFSYN